MPNHIGEVTYQKMKAVGYVHRVTKSGNITDDMRDFYDYAFYILATSSLYGLTEKTKYLDEADALLDWIRQVTCASGRRLAGVKSRQI